MAPPDDELNWIRNSLAGDVEAYPGRAPDSQTGTIIHFDLFGVEIQRPGGRFFRARRQVVFVGGIGGQPIAIDAQTKFPVGFSGFRGTGGLDIVQRAVAGVTGRESKTKPSLPGVGAAS